MIDALEPKRELGIEEFQALGSLAGQAQAGFEVLLDREQDGV
jgi:hypothetical protein